MQDLFEAIREECSTRIWSRGVELARAEAVVGQREGGDEVVLRVSTRGGMISPTVTLYLEDPDWECECSNSEPVCEHVAASVIALRQSRKQGAPLPRPRKTSGNIRYHLTRKNAGLSFHRCVVVDGEERPLRSTLDAIASGRIDGPRFAASSADVAVERALGSKRRGKLDRAAMRRLIEPLSRCDDVLLDGEPVRASSEPAGLRGKVHGAPLMQLPALGIAEHGVGHGSDLASVKRLAAHRMHLAFNADHRRRT